MPTLTFHGAAGTVTGSRYLIETRGERLLVDCGLFQGLKALRERNWEHPPFDPRSLRWVVLTHAHIDHCGWLPRMYRLGFRGKIFATSATSELAGLMLMDAAQLQEEDAEFLNRKGATKHRPALPLYDENDARAVLRLFETVPYERWKRLSSRLSFRLICVGHLLGSAMVELRIARDRAHLRMPVGWEEAQTGEVSGRAAAEIPSPESLDARRVVSADTAAAESDREGGVPLAVGAPETSVRIRSAATTTEDEIENDAPPDATETKEAVEEGLSKPPEHVTVLFSGDVGRYSVPLAPDPRPPVECDVLVVESTYGDRPHRESDVYEDLALVAERTFRRGGILLVPAFAVGRSQQVIYMLRELFARERLPRVPVHLDSPMAVDATRIYGRYARELDPLGTGRTDPAFLAGPEIIFHRSRMESIQLNSFDGPGVIISSSGMLTGGRVLHHLVRLLPDPRNTILLVGFQAAGTRGRALCEGAHYVRIHGGEVEVRAEVVVIHGMSGHADAEELLRWTSGLRPPRRVFVTHGEVPASEALAGTLQRERGWHVVVPSLHQSFEI